MGYKPDGMAIALRSVALSRKADGLSIPVTGDSLN